MTATSHMPFDSDEWRVKNKAAAISVEATESKLVLTAGKETDWWRTARGSEPESDVDRHSGPLYVTQVDDAQTHWTAGVWIATRHAERFQQAALFVAQGGDEVEQRNLNPWLKVGVELENGKQQIGSVVAAPIADWALFPAPKPISDKPDEWLYVQVQRTGADAIISWAHGKPSPAGEDAVPNDVHLMREIKGFAKQLGSPWNVGVMTCGPKSQATTSTFHHFHLVHGQRESHDEEA